MKHIDPNFIKKEFESYIQVAQESRDVLASSILSSAELLLETLSSGGTVFVCGNGGSAADSQHFVAELVWRFKVDGRRALPAIALTTDTSNITAIGNDIGFEHIFSRQLEALGKEGDVLVAISTSGTSENVVRALEVAKQKNIATILLTGKKGSDLGDVTDIIISVPSDITSRIQEIHEFIIHTWCGYIDKQFQNNNGQ